MSASPTKLGGSSRPEHPGKRRADTPAGGSAKGGRQDETSSLRSRGLEKKKRTPMAGHVNNLVT